METLRSGSRGEAVKALQKALGFTGNEIDGIYGSQTIAAVCLFQKNHSLEIDGVAGPKTLEALGLNTTKTSSKCVDPSVTYSPLSVHISAKENREIKYIAIHFTAGGSSKAGRALNTKHTFEQRQASADFCIDDSQIVQFNPDLHRYYCWSVGDKATTFNGGASLAGKAFNRNTVSIEICSSLKSGSSCRFANHDGWYFTDSAIDNAVKLTKILMKQLNIPLDRVVRHYDISGKLCPGLVGWNDGYIYTDDGKKTGQKNNSNEWLKFKQRLV